MKRNTAAAIVFTAVQISVFIGAIVFAANRDHKVKTDPADFASEDSFTEKTKEKEVTMEIFDVVDENGNPTGEKIERSKAHENGIRHRTAHTWVARKNNGHIEFLLQKRNDDKESFPGCYDTSSAGHIHAGDEPLISAVRELEEELGIKADPEELDFAGTFYVNYEKEFFGKMFKDNEIPFVYIYKGNVDVSELKLQKEEVSGVKWFTSEEISAMIEKHDKTCCVPKDGFLLAKKWCETYL